MSAGSVIAIGFGVWVLVVGLVIALVRAAGRPEPGPAAFPGEQSERYAPASPEEVSIERSFGGTLRALAREDPGAGRHAAAVARNALALAQCAGLPRRDQEIAHVAGLLHDIGKESSLSGIPVAERALRKDDHRMIRSHPVEGARLVRRVPGLEPVADAVLAHHERLDGNGYPYGLRGQAIPPAARVVAVAEVYDVLTSPDSYKPAMPSELALEELRDSAGTQLDPELVEIFASQVAGGADDGFPEADLETELRRRPLAAELLDA